MRERDYPPDPHGVATQAANIVISRGALRLLVGAAMILLSIATWFLGSIWTNQQAMSTTVVRIDTTLNERVIRQVDSNTAINTKQTDDIDDLKNRVSRLEATVKVP